MTIDRAAWRKLLAEATPAPWEPGHIWIEAGLLPEKFGAGRCACCHLGPPEWTGDMDINGTVMPAHRHRNPEPWNPDHLISGPDGATVVGGYDYDASGVVRPEDLALAIAARNELPALLDQLDAADEALARVERERDAWKNTAVNPDSHIWEGACPDADTGPDSRDPFCPGCAAIDGQPAPDRTPCQHQDDGIFCTQLAAEHGPDGCNEPGCHCPLTPQQISERWGS